METQDKTIELRLLEGWLLLAQTLNEELDWRMAPQRLEQLLLQTASALAYANNLAEARAILVWYQAHAMEIHS